MRLITDNAGASVSRHDYLALGEEVFGGKAGRDSHFGSYDNVTQRFTGKEADAESGLNYFGARYYGSALGRFTSPDPLAGIDPYDPQSWNAYAYGRNNPLSYVDPTGESYQICDVSGQNCTDQKNALTDDEFASEKRAGQANGEVFSNGTFSHTDANGNNVVDGTYRQTDVDIDGNAADNQRGARQIGATSAVGDPLLQITLGFIMGPGSGAMEGPMPAGGLGRIEPPSGPAPSSKYEDITSPGSRYANRGTDVSKSQFEKNLSDSGWSKSTSQDGRVSIYTKGGARYVVRDGARSTGGPTADYYAPGSKSIDVKVRLQ